MKIKQFPVSRFFGFESVFSELFAILTTGCIFILICFFGLLSTIVDTLIYPFIWIYNTYRYISLEALFEGKLNKKRLHSWVFSDWRSNIFDWEIISLEQILKDQLGRTFPFWGFAVCEYIRLIKSKAVSEINTVCILKVAHENNPKKIYLYSWYVITFELKDGKVTVGNLAHFKSEEEATREFDKLPSYPVEIT